MPYVDGFIVPIPKKNVEEHRKLAQVSADVWREHGALEYRERIAVIYGGFASFIAG